MTAPDSSSKELRKLITSFAHETNHTPEWYSHPKHIFVLTWTGKPLFTRYGDDNKLVEIIGTLSAFITNFAEMLNNPLVSFQSGIYNFVILNKEPLFFVCVSRTQETVSQIHLQLSLLYHQLISILTTNIIDVLRDQPGYDPREQLGGTDLLSHSLLTEFDRNLPLLTQALPTLRFNKNSRLKLFTALKKFKMKDAPLMFSMIIVDGKIVALIKNKPNTSKQEEITSNHLFHYDLALLMNLINNQPSLRASESLTPICLPFSNPGELVYVYSRFLPINFNKKSDKLYDNMIIAKNQLERTIYPYHQQSLQGITTVPLSPEMDFASSPLPIDSFSISSDVCLVTVASHPMLFPKCQQHCAQLLQYLEKNYGETTISDYTGALFANQLTRSTRSPLQRSDTGNGQQTQYNDNNNNNSLSLSTSSSSSNNNNNTTPLISSPSFTSHQLESQTVYNDLYLFDSIRSKARNHITSFLETTSSSSRNTISLLHELHYASLPTGTARIYPWELDVFDPKTPPPYITPVLQPPNNPTNPSNPHQQLAHITTDLSHFLYIDFKTQTAVDSEALAPYRYLTTTGVSVNVPQGIKKPTLLNQPSINLNSSNNSTSSPLTPNSPSTTQSSSTTTTTTTTTTTSLPIIGKSLNIAVPASPTLNSQSNIPTTPKTAVPQSHVDLIVAGKYLDSDPLTPPTPFHLGGHGVICVTTTNTTGLYPEHDPTNIIAQSTIQPSVVHDHDFIRVPIAPCITAVNTLAAHVSLTDRYKRLHAKTHKYTNPKLSMCIAAGGENEYDEHNQTSFALLPTMKPLSTSGLTTIPTFIHKTITKRPYNSSSMNPNPTLSQQKDALNSQSALKNNLTEPIVFYYEECHDAIVVYQSKPGLYELYCTFPPLTSRESISNTLHRVVISIQKDYDTYFNRVVNV